MKNFMSYYGSPLLTIIIGAFIYTFVNLAVPNNQNIVILSFFKACICFAFGISLYHHKKSKTWVKKLLVAFLFVFLILFDMGYNIVPQFSKFLINLSIKGFILDLIYVYCGWTFFH